MRDAARAAELEREKAAYLDATFKRDLSEFRRWAENWLEACQLKLTCLMENRQPRNEEGLSILWKFFDNGVMRSDGVQLPIIEFAVEAFGMVSKPLYMTEEEHPEIKAGFVDIREKYCELPGMRPADLLRIQLDAVEAAHAANQPIAPVVMEPT